MKRIRFNKAREIRDRREEDAVNMITIDADLAGSKPLDLGLRRLPPGPGVHEDPEAERDPLGDIACN